MWSLLLQSLVLLLAAYFVGVWIGCMARRLIAPPKSKTGGQQLQSASPQPAPDQVASSSSVAATPAAQATREQTVPTSSSVDPAMQAAAAASAAVATAAAAAQQAAQVENTPPDTPETVSVAQQIQTIGTSADPVAARSHIKPEPFPDGRLPAAVGGGGDAASSVAAVVAQPEPEPEPPAARPMPQDLTAIQGIDAATAVVLEREGVTRYEQLPAWKEGDVARINRALGGMRRVQEQNWIEQAKILAGGGLTAYARRRKASAAAGAPSHTHIVQPSPDQGDAVSLGAAANSSTVTAVNSAASDSTPSSFVAADVIGDDLTAIEGITPEIANLLREQGLTRYAQIARLDETSANRLNGLLGIEQRVQKQGWAEQAAALSGAIPITVAAPAVQAATVAATAVTSTAVTPAGSEQDHHQEAAVAPDKLMRIRGIGDVIEHKLQSLGFTTYASIADWTEQDVRKVSEALDFRGRIERENWIEQARILATGGQTEFSRRFDTGE